METEQHNLNKNKRWKGGRPRKGARERRSAQQNTRLSSEEKGRFVQKAKLLGLKPCDLARRLLLGSKLPRSVPQLNQEAWRELAALANDLRALLHLVRSGQRAGVDQSLLENLLECIRQFRRDVRGEQ